MRVKMPQKRENAIFCISTKMGYKVYITGVQGAEKGKMGEEDAFFVQVGSTLYKAEFQDITQIVPFFVPKNFVFRLCSQGFSYFLYI